MRNGQIKQLVNVLQAYLNGKTIQYYDVDYRFKIAHPGERNFNNKWVDVDEDHLFRPDFYDYRVKPEPKYRPFKDADECWQEMLKHQPFGWVKEKGDKLSYELLACVSENDEAPISFAVYGSVGMGIIDRPSIEFNEMFNAFTFADSAPFGVKEEV
ncbi:MAG: hypothetical protein MR736_03490 [Prevotella pectinovora]|uniref:hypothetical protein n=1 Tax=Prevotella pectinovora TaxID=1602169 RepID=UPI002431A9E2|nr:hypothetical protein [Prevotella pectinovora]MCI6047629.1 hypothetical protein [Prevotella pectinovora]